MTVNLSSACFRASASLQRCAAQAVMVLALPATVSGALASPVSVQVVDAAGQPLPDAAVAVFVAGTPATTTAARAEVAQKGRAFVPYLLVVQTGTAVVFPNQDKVRHHVYSFSPSKPFEIKLYGGEVAPAVVFDKPGTVVIGCNIHDRMLAYIHVVDTPHFARTGVAGRARLDLPPGTHRLQVWHPALGDAQAPLSQTMHVPTPDADLVVTLDAKAGAGR